MREVALVAFALLCAALAERVLPSSHVAQSFTQVERGRQVYISEGCIHCHSQYVRPNSDDELMWGPVEPIRDLRKQNPPLIGNRRQGPDLAEVGTRRSALWLKAHFYDPAQVSGSSIMPSYGFLFRDGRGDDLVAYLGSLQSGDTAEHLAEMRRWQPSAEAVAKAGLSEGKQLYQRDCANCHGVDGAVRRAWQSSFKRIPTDLAKGPFVYLLPSFSERQRTIRLEQIVKFGIPGTDMPGHEYLSDTDIASISLWIAHSNAQSSYEP